MKDEQNLVETLLAHDTDDPIPPEHERRIREGLGALLGGPVAAPDAPDAPDTSPAPPAPPPGAAQVAQGALAKWITVLAVVGAAGGGFAVGRSTAPASVAPAPAPPASVVSSMPSSPSAAAPASASSAPPSTSAVASSSSAVTATVATATTPPPTDAFDREQSLLERARSALVRHDADAAQRALDESEQRFPRSRHAEERDYLRIQISRERGDTARARDQARAFLAKYPESLLRSRVEPFAN